MIRSAHPVPVLSLARQSILAYLNDEVTGARPNANLRPGSWTSSEGRIGLIARKRLHPLGAFFAALIGLAGMLVPTTAYAGEGNGNYLGILSSSAPTGYTPSPGIYSLAQGQSTLTFSFTVTNLTSSPQSMNLELDLNHILTYQVNGQQVNVADGQPGVVNGAVVDGQFDPLLSTQAADPSPTFTLLTLGPNEVQTLQLTRALSQCGYYQVDVAKQGLTSQKGLIGFEIRVLGCGTPSIVTTPAPAAGTVGDSIADSAVVSGGINPTGTVTFALYGPGDTTCSGSNLVSGTGFSNVALVAGSAASGSFTTSQAGTYNWVATYSGDVNNQPATSGCGAEAVVIQKAQPGISTTPSPSVATVGAAIHDSATVTGGFSPTGTVTFGLYAPGDTSCAGTNLVQGVAGFVVPLSSGSATSAAYATTQVGTYNWVATYGGDANNLGATSGCSAEQVVIKIAHPAIITLPVPTLTVVGGLIHDTASVTGGFNPTGTVTFALYGPGDTTCSGTNLVSTLSGFANVGLVSGSASSANYTTVLAGTYNWVATYSGDANNAPAGSGCGAEQVVVQRAQPAISTVPSPTQAALGSLIHDSATVTGGFGPTGTVTFALYGPGDTACSGTNLVAGLAGFDNVALSGGSATSANFMANQVGTYNWVAAYSGDANNASVVSGCGTEQVTITKPLGGQGCTPGYWKQPQHFHSWTGYVPTQLISSVFNVPSIFPDGTDGSSLSGSTLLAGLAFQGGSTLNGSAQILLRAAIAGLLNANNPNVAYPMTTAQIVTSVNAALNSGSRNTMLNLASSIDNANNGQGGCPLS